MSYTLNENTTLSWDGKTGSAVHEIISSEFSRAANAINTIDSKTPTGLDGEISQDNTTVSIWMKDSAGNRIGSKYQFSTVTQSTYTDSINILSYERIIDHGSNFVINYNYQIQDGSENIAGYRATLLIKVNGRDIPSKTTVASKSTGRASGTIEIESRYLSEGLNNIDIQYFTSLGSGGQTSTKSCPRISVYSTQLNVVLQSSKSIFASAKAFDESITLSFAVKNSNNSDISTISIDGEEYSPNIRIYIDSISSNQLALESSTLNITTSLQDLIENCPAYLDVQSIKYGAKELKLLVQAYIEDANENDIVSSIPIVIYIANDDYNVNTDIALSGVFYPSYVNDNGEFGWTKNQYTSYIFANNTNELNIDSVLYLYSKSTVQATIRIGSYTFDQSITENTCSQFIYTHLCRTTGDLLFRINKKGSNDYDFDSRIRVTQLSSGFVELTDQVINYNCENIVITNNSTVEELRQQTWVSNNYTATFSNFDWSVSKWAIVNNKKCLQLSGDATVTIPYNVYNIQQNSSGFAVSFRYKLSKSLDKNPVIYCLDGDNGFSITPGHLYFNTGSVLRLDIDDSDIHEVTFVLYNNIEANGVWKNLQVIYIDGKLQAMGNCGSIPLNNKNIIINSQDAVLHLYNVNIFNRALSFMEVESLFCFNSKTGQSLSNYIALNSSVINVNNSTNIYNQTSGSDNGTYGQYITPASIPDGSIYVVISSFTETVEENGRLYKVSVDPDPWLTINSYIKDAEEKNKGRKHLVGSVELYEKNGNTNRNFYALLATLSAQGTSSMGYALKNFRIYFQKPPKNVDYVNSYKKVQTTKMWLGVPEGFVPDENSDSLYTTITSDIGYSLFSSDYGSGPDAAYTKPSAPAATFCFKADYAESSGSHNTGFARLANEAMKESDPVNNDSINPHETYHGTPQQQMDDGWDYDIRTNIDGRPVYLFFYRPECYPQGAVLTDESNKLPAKYYYAGRYNMNNDKSNEKVFGFCDIPEYFSNNIVKQEGTILANLARNYDPKFDETHSTYTLDGNDYINPTECWEFSTNEGYGGEIGAFVYDKTKAFTEVDPLTNDAEFDGFKLLKWMVAWEYRYPDIDGGGTEDGYYRKGISRPYLLQKTYDFLYDNAYYLDLALSKLNNFALNLKLYFNVNNVLKYYVLTNWFGCRDQRVKNTMLSFYCDPNQVSAEEAAQSPLHYMRGYFIFYDNDTILGLNNAGYLDVNSDGSVGTPWDFEEDYQGMSHAQQTALWYNLSECLKLYMNGQYTTSVAYKLGGLICETYKKLRDQITNSAFESYFNTQHVNYYPDTIQNVDSEIKYLYPDQVRLKDFEGDPRVGAYTAVSYNKNTGTRQWYRDLWFNNRTIWLDNLNKHTNDQNYNIAFKGIADPGDERNGTLTNILFKVCSKFKKWRIYTFGGDTGVFEHDAKSWKDNLLSVNETYSKNTDAHIGGMYGIEEITIPELTISEFSIYGQLPYLKKFTLNSGLAPDEGFPRINSNNVPTLQELRINNFNKDDGGNFSSVDLSSFTKLSVVDFSGTKISSVILPPNATSISLDSPQQLQLNGLNNILTITISNYSTSMSNILVSDSCPSVYDQALLIGSSMATSNRVITININFNGSELYGFNGLSQTYMNYLNNIATACLNRSDGSTINVQGSVYIDSGSSFDTSTIESAFPQLNIQRNDSSEAVIEVKDPSDPTVKEGQHEFNGTAIYQYEGILSQEVSEDILNECQIFTANRDITKWSFLIGGEPGTLSGMISIVKTTKRKCWIHANPNGANRSETHALTVNGTYAGSDTPISKQVNIVYRKISSITLNPTTYYATDNVTIHIEFNEHTKKYLLNSVNLSISPTGSVDLTDLADVKASTGSINDDTTFTVTFGTDLSDSVFSSVKIYYNTNIGKDANGNDQTMNVLGNDKTNPKYWISLLPPVLNQTFGSYITKSRANDITLTSSHINDICGRLTSAEASVLDFSDLQYFKCQETFTLPSYQFSNLVTPKNCGTVVMTNFNSEYANSYGIVKFTSNVKKINISLSITSIPSDLQFDLSDTTIKNIGYYPSLLNNYASVNITYNGDTSPTKREKVLFIYPTTLETIGNEGTFNNGVSTFPSTAMFNIATSSASTNVYSNYYPQALFNLGAIGTNIHLGLVAAYLIDGSAFSDSSYIRSCAWAYPRNSNLIKLDVTGEENKYYSDQSNLTSIGSCSFSRLGTNYNPCQQIDYLVFGQNNNITSIGKQAFYYGTYQLRDTQGSDSVHFNNILSIESRAFYGMTQNQNIHLGQSGQNTIKNIEAYAFGTLDNITLNIYFHQSAAIMKTATVSGLDASAFERVQGLINVYAPQGSQLYEQLQACTGITLYTLELA